MKKIQFNQLEDLSRFDIFDDRAQLTVWQGEQVLRLEGARPVLIPDAVTNLPFRLECEVAIEGKAGFAGCVFGAKNSDDYQAVYVYPDSEQSGGWIQYDISMNGSMTWQIYHGDRYQSDQVHVEPGSWTKLCVDVYETRAEITVGENDTPQLVIEPLILNPLGKVGLWGSLPIYVKSISFMPISKKPTTQITPDPLFLPEGLITDWELVPDDGQLPYADRPLKWQKATVEENGVLNVNRLYPMSTKKVFVRTHLFYEEEQVIRLQFGFSDHLRLWVHDQEIYEGTFLWNPPTEDGRIRIDHEKVEVTMKRGDNVIYGWLSVEEPGFGWGIMMAASKLNSG